MSDPTTTTTSSDGSIPTTTDVPVTTTTTEIFSETRIINGVPAQVSVTRVVTTTDYITVIN